MPLYCKMKLPFYEENASKIKNKLNDLNINIFKKCCHGEKNKFDLSQNDIEDLEICIS